ncbi:3239_t:CDS:2, partial [Racocetra fulgida]
MNLSNFDDNGIAFMNFIINFDVNQSTTKKTTLFMQLFDPEYDYIDTNFDLNDNFDQNDNDPFSISLLDDNKKIQKEVFDDKIDEVQDENKDLKKINYLE